MDTLEQTALKAQAWIKTLPDIKWAYPETITIGKKNFASVSYGTNDHANLYVLGEKPKNWENYLHISQDGKWVYMLCSYTTENSLKPEYANFHPFGHNFILQLLTLKQAIDIDMLFSLKQKTRTIDREYLEVY